jgi:undecaprenyl-diphosphatase
MTELAIWQAGVLGLLQGIAEFLPISSSAHLSLAPWAFKWPEPGLAFDVALHVGTLFAVVAYFRLEWVALARAAGRMVAARRMPRDEHERRVVLLIVATIPGLLGGYLLNDYAETLFRAPALTATALMVMGLVLWAVDRRAPVKRQLSQLTVVDALLIGVAQVAALIPGVSRSGATITAGRGLGADREGAAVFSFLLSMPITAAAAIFEARHAIRNPGAVAPLLVGIACAAVSGWIAIALLLRLVRTRGYGGFAVYRLVLGAAVLALVFARG